MLNEMLKSLAVKEPSVLAVLEPNKVFLVEVPVTANDWQKLASVDASQPNDSLEKLPVFLMER